MNYESIKITIDRKIAVVTIHRPESLNALNTQVFNDLENAFDDLENENISITSTQLSAINSKFAEFIRSNEFTKFYCEETTKINVCLLNIQYQKPIEFYDKIIQNQQCLDIPYLLP